MKRPWPKTSADVDFSKTARYQSGLNWFSTVFASLVYSRLPVAIDDHKLWRHEMTSEVNVILLQD